MAQKILQPGEDTSVVSDGREDCICGISGATFEIAAAEVAFCLEVTDHGLDGRASSQLAFDDAEDAAFLAGDEDSARAVRVMAAVSLVDIAALDLAADELLGTVGDNR